MECRWVVTDAPPLDLWIDELVDRGWQAVRHEGQRYVAVQEIGASRFPVRLATTWRLELEDTPEGAVTVTVDVPAFADSLYAEDRIREYVADLAIQVGVDPDSAPTEPADLLGHLRELEGRGGKYR